MGFDIRELGGRKSTDLARSIVQGRKTQDTDSLLFKRRSVKAFAGAHDFSMGDANINVASGDINIYQRAPRKRGFGSIQRLCHWLSATNARKAQMEVLSKRTSGTGVWLIEDPRFTSWSRHETGQNILWVTGIPGAGKTTLAFIVVDHIQQVLCAPSRGETAVIFFQCQHAVPSSPCDILSTFLRQLLEDDSQDLFSIIDPVYVDCQMKSMPLSEERALSTLAKIMELYQKVYIVVDALDELQESTRNNLLRLLISLPKGHIFVTSRPMNIGDPSHHGRPVMHLPIDEQNRSDISTFVSTALKESVLLSDLLTSDAPAHDQIIEKVNQNSQGMFLLASLQVKLLTDCISRKDLLKKVDQLPSGVKAMYQHTMSRIENQGENRAALAKRTLLWITHAQTSLSMESLRRALAISPEDGYDKDDLSPESLILSCCCGLVVIDGSTRFVRLFHLTANDFVRDHIGQLFTSPHAFIAHRCIAYLSSPIDPSSSPLPLEPYPSASSTTTDADWECEDGRLIPFPYAYIGWGNHARRAWSEPERKIQHRLSEFIFGCKDYVCNISKVSAWHGSLCATNETVQPIHLIATYGITDLLSDQRDQWDQRTSSHSTPLHLAVCHGHEDIVRTLLVDRPSRIHDVDEHGFMPFMVACQYGHAETVDMFLCSFDDLQINAKTKTRPTTALILATKGQFSDLHPPSTAGDMSSRNKTWTQSETRSSSLWANNKVEVEGARLSEAIDQLQHLANLMRQASILSPQSPSTNASTQPHLTSGSTSNTTTGGGHPNSSQGHATNTTRGLLLDTMGIAAEKAGSRLRIVKSLLMRPDLEVNAQDDEGYTALMYAAKLGLQSLVECLLSHPDISVNTKTFKTNTTALMLACAGGHRGIVELLLARPEVDVEVQDSSQRSALTISVEANQDRDIIVALLRAIPKGSLKPSNRITTPGLV